MNVSDGAHYRTISGVDVRTRWVWCVFSLCGKYVIFLHMIYQWFIRKPVLLQIFSASLPVSTTPERTFSALEILKTYLRSRLPDENMQELSMTYIHKDIPINTDEVISHFLRLKVGDWSYRYADWWLKFAEHKWTTSLQFTNASLRVTVSDFNSDLSSLLLILVLLFMDVFHIITF